MQTVVYHNCRCSGYNGSDILLILSVKRVNVLIYDNLLGVLLSIIW